MKAKIILTVIFSLTLCFTHLLFGQTFTKIDTGIVVRDGGPSAGSSWGDYDNDGLQDLFVPNWGQNVSQCFLYHNEGDGIFTKVNSGEIVNEQGYFGGACWGDYDNDSDLDIFIPRRNDSPLLFENDGVGNFTKIQSSPLTDLTEPLRGSSWIDLNMDGYLDLFLINYGNNYLFENQRDGTFAQIKDHLLTLINKKSIGYNWVDYDNDGDFDLFVSEFRYVNSFYINQGNGTFLLDSTSNIINDEISASTSWGDYDNDGDLDLYVTNFFSPNSLYENKGDGSFEKIMSGNIVTDNGCITRGCNWGDFDNDGDLDMLVTNTQGNTNCYYSNEGEGEFTKITSGSFVENEGGVNTICDYDNDGDLDVFVTNAGASGANFIYANDGNNNNWINFTFNGLVSNKSGIGVRVKVKANISGKDIWQMREISLPNPTLGQNSLCAHFGLGDASIIDSVIIKWPCGMIQTLTNVQVNQFLTIEEPINQHDMSVIPDLNLSTHSTIFTYRTPRAVIRNMGSEMESNIPVICEISKDNTILNTETHTINSLNSLKTNKIDFNEFVFREAGTYDQIFFSQLNDDHNNFNDTMRSQIKVTNLMDDFEEGLRNWSFNNSGTELSSAFKYNGDYSLNIKYENENESWVEFNHVFDLSKLENAYISFYEKYFLEQNNDFACVEISSDSGVTWAQIGELITGVGLNWTKKDIDLTNYSGPGFEEIKLRFKIIPNSTIVLPGWFLDDIAIYSGKISNIDKKEYPTPDDYKLLTNYPNPFNSSTIIQYNVPEASNIKIVVYNIMGQEIVRLVDGYHQAGNFRVSWDGKDNTGQLAPSGLYFFELEANDFSDCKKMLLIQ